MPVTDPSRPHPPGRRIWSAFKRLLQARVTAGLIVVLPIWLTYVVVKFIFGLMRDASAWVIYGLLRGDWVRYVPKSWGESFAGWTDAELARSSVQWSIAVFSVFLTIFLLYVIGLFTANLLGKRVLYAVEALLDRLPLIKTVYRATKQILETFTGEQSQTFQRVALFPFGGDRAKSVGFVTNSFTDPRSGEELVTIFYATTPNPTTGFIFICRRCEIVELDWSVEEAVKAIMSGGILLPAKRDFGDGFKARPAGSPDSART